MEEIKDFKELQKQLLEKHRYRLSDDDPILMYVTLQQHLLSQTEQAFKEITNDFIMKLASTVTVADEDTKAMAEKMIGAAVTVSKQINEDFISKQVVLFQKIKNSSADEINAIKEKIDKQRLLLLIIAGISMLSLITGIIL